MQIAKTKEERTGLVVTILVHLLLLLCFILFGLKYTYPPPNDDLLINFGTSNDGSGEVQPEEVGETQATKEVIEEQVPPSNPETSPVKEEVMTQETESVAIPEETEAQKQERLKEEKKQAEQAAFRKKMAEIWKKTGASEGETGKTGDQGDPNGDKNAKNRTGGPTGKNGVGYSLSNRKMLSVPKIIDNSQDVGKVVVRIVVDQQGAVLSAEAGVRGTTTNSKSLWNKAKQAALKAKFSPSVDIYTPHEQSGTMTFVFVLQ